jgi:hypothetical protein
VIRLVRIDAASDAAPAGLVQLASAGPLDLLQLDYARPRLVVSSSDAPPELPEFPDTFSSAVRSLCRTLFLEPEFRVVSSAGWSNSYTCAELAGKELVAVGNPEVPVSAVRGSNLMGILDYLIADGLNLDNADTGAPWSSLRAPVLAADLQLGAGPLATAIAEGGRVIVAGCYDGAAPTLAAAVAAFGWSWKQLDVLGAAAGAARAAIWPHQHAWDGLASGGSLSSTHRHSRVQLDSDGTFTVDLAHPVSDNDAHRLREWLQAGKPRDPSHLHADVRFDAKDAAVACSGTQQLRASACTGAKSDDRWRLDVLYQAGFLAEAMVEFAPGTPAALRRQVAEAFRSHFVNAEDEHSLVTAQELASPDGDAAAASWLHLACRCKIRQPCAEFVDHISRFANANPTIARLPAGRPLVQVECGLWPARVPRGAVDIAVDTRPAREWE